MAPLYASLTARLMALNGTASVQSLFQNGGYYSVLSFNDVTTGNNGGFKAGIGWDAVTGIGSFSSFAQSVKTTITTTTTTTTVTLSKQTNSINGTYSPKVSSANSPFVFDFSICSMIFIQILLKSSQFFS